LFSFCCNHLIFKCKCISKLCSMKGRITRLWTSEQSM
jgi:hypothetical protein